MAAVCAHGNLRRSCELCERDATIADLRRQLEEAEGKRIASQVLSIRLGNYAEHQDCEWVNTDNPCTSNKCDCRLEQLLVDIKELEDGP